MCLKRCGVFLIMLLFGDSVVAASAYWSGVSLSNSGIYGSPTHVYVFGGGLIPEGGKWASLSADIFGHAEGGRLFLEQQDFSQELDPSINRWMLATYGDVIDENTFRNALTKIPTTFQYDFDGNGIEVESYSDFYMVFKLTEPVISGNNVLEGQTWYGWVHVSVDETDLKMTLLGSGINLEGGAVTVGAIPEPCGGVLLLVGAALLALKRRRLSP